MKKGKYIDYQTLLAALSKPPVNCKKEFSAFRTEQECTANFKPRAEDRTTSINSKKAA